MTMKFSESKEWRRSFFTYRSHPLSFSLKRLVCQHPWIRLNLLIQARALIAISLAKVPENIFEEDLCPFAFVLVSHATATYSLQTL